MAFGSGLNRGSGFNCVVAEDLVDYFLSIDEGRKWIEEVLQEKGFNMDLKSVSVTDLGLNFIVVDTNLEFYSNYQGQRSGQIQSSVSSLSLFKEVIKLIKLQGGFGTFVLNGF